MNLDATATGTQESVGRVAQTSPVVTIALNLAIAALVCALVLIWRLPIFNNVLYAPDRVHNFGAVTRGAVVKHTFTLRNLHPWPVMVTSAVGGCGCTKVFPGKEVPFSVPPFGSFQVKAQLDTEAKMGRET